MGVGQKQRRSARMLAPQALVEAAECLKVLAHPHRLKMVEMLLAGDYAVGELAEACGIASPMASEHLRLMQRCGFLTSRREGRRIYYDVCERHVARLMDCIEERFGGPARTVRRRGSTGGLRGR